METFKEFLIESTKTREKNANEFYLAFSKIAHLPHKEKGKDGNDVEDIYGKEINKIYELVDRNTPEEVIVVKDPNRMKFDWYMCPKCKNQVVKANFLGNGYCSHCGKALLWLKALGGK